MNISNQQREHALAIADRFGQMIVEKYKRGQEEHGGNLWEKTDLIDRALEEVTDLAIYLLTLRQQLVEFDEDLTEVAYARYCPEHMINLYAGVVCPECGKEGIGGPAIYADNYWGV